jgi:hypothetical protein
MIIKNFITKNEIDNILKSCNDCEVFQYTSHISKICNNKINFVKERVAEIFGKDMIYGFEHIETLHKPRGICCDVDRLNRQMFPKVGHYPEIYPPIKQLGFTFCIPLNTYKCKTIIYEQKTEQFYKIDEYIKNNKIKPNKFIDEKLFLSPHLNKKYTHYLNVLDTLDWEIGSLHYYDQHYFFSTNDWSNDENQVSSIIFWSYYPE